MAHSIALFELCRHAEDESDRFGQFWVISQNPNFPVSDLWSQWCNYLAISPQLRRISKKSIGLFYSRDLVPSVRAVRFTKIESNRIEILENRIELNDRNSIFCVYWNIVTIERWNRAVLFLGPGRVGPGRAVIFPDLFGPGLYFSNFRAFLW